MLSLEAAFVQSLLENLKIWLPCSHALQVFPWPHWLPHFPLSGILLFLWGLFYFLAIVTTWVPSVRALNLITMQALRAPQVNLQTRLPPCRSFLRMQLPARPAPWLADRPPQLHTSRTNPWGAPHPLQTSPGFYISANGILVSQRPKYQSLPFLLSYPTTWNPCVLSSSVVSLCDPRDCSPPDSSVHGISQAWMLEWVAISSSRGCSRPRDQTRISCIGRPILHHWATWEAHRIHTLHPLACQIFHLLLVSFPAASLSHEPLCPAP